MKTSLSTPLSSFTENDQKEFFLIFFTFEIRFVYATHANRSPTLADHQHQHATHVTKVSTSTTQARTFYH